MRLPPLIHSAGFHTYHHTDYLQFLLVLDFTTFYLILYHVFLLLHTTACLRLFSLTFLLLLFLHHHQPACLLLIPHTTLPVGNMRFPVCYGSLFWDVTATPITPPACTHTTWCFTFLPAPYHALPAIDFPPPFLFYIHYYTHPHHHNTVYFGRSLFSTCSSTCSFSFISGSSYSYVVHTVKFSHVYFYYTTTYLPSVLLSGTPFPATVCSWDCALLFFL